MAIRSDPVLGSTVFCAVHHAGFDGNHSDALTQWVFPEPTFDGITENAWSLLVAMTADGDLGWCIFPPAGYRV